MSGPPSKTAAPKPAVTPLIVPFLITTPVTLPAKKMLNATLALSVPAKV